MSYLSCTCFPGGRWYSQAPVGGRYFRNQKKGSSPTGRKKTPTYRTAHPPNMDDAVYTPPTRRPNLYYIQQDSSAAVRTAVHVVRAAQLVGWFLRTLYETGNIRGEIPFLTILGHLGERASRRPPPTHHPRPTHHLPFTHEPTQYSSTAMQQ